MKVELNCKNCKNNFEAEFKHRNKKFCSRKCYFGYNKTNKIMGRKKDNSIREKRNCAVCNNEFETKISTQTKMCSDECRKIWNSIDDNKKKRIESSKKAILVKHGVDTIFKTEDFKNNYKKNIFEKYGVDNPMKYKLFVDNLKESLKIKQIDSLLPKLKENDLILLDEYTVNKNGNTSLPYNFKCLKCENIFTSTILGSGKIPICRKCFPLVKNSKIEESVRDFLNNNSIKHLDNDRKILNGKEIDLFLSDFNLGIEINGNYYHSELSGNKDRKYHLEKTKIANNKNVKLVHIFEDELLYKKDIVISRLSNLLGINNNKIFARKCIIKEVTKEESKKFLNDNHIQGVSIDKIRLGLYYECELVSLMTFGEFRKSMGYNAIENNYELLRFCNKLNTSVVGSFSKLLKSFIKTYQPKKILTYADVRWSGLDKDKTVYFKNGFEYIGLTPPNYWYLKIGEYNNRFHRYNFRKDILVKEGYDSTLTEVEIMRIKGYDRIWDCGNMKFEMNF